MKKIRLKTKDGKKAMLRIEILKLIFALLGFEVGGLWEIYMEKRVYESAETGQMSIYRIRSEKMNEI